MKYAIVIPDGAADDPLEQLDGRTPFEAAEKPHTDRLAREGRQGTVVTTPEGMPCGSDVCTMSLLGYDPRQYHKGRAPLEAAAMGLELEPTDWVFRVNLVTVIDGIMQDHSAGHIADGESRQLLADLAARAPMPEMAIHPGVSYRHVLADTSGRDYSELVTTPPHDILGEPIARHLPTGGEQAQLLRDLIETSAEVFAEHEINATRRELGELPATHVWPWGQGQPPAIPAFADRFGLKGAMITAVDLLAGLAGLIGWDRLPVPGQTSYHDTDYEAAGRYAVDALADYDVVCVHIEAPDEASHQADVRTKIAAIEAVDAHVMGPLLEALERDHGDEWRLLYMPDHYTRISTRKHDPTPPPFAIGGKRMRNVVERPFMERHANACDLHIQHGHELMEYFLYSGLGPH